VDTFKQTDSNDVCQDCSFFAANTDTDGQSGLTFCYCTSGKEIGFRLIIVGTFNASLYDTNGEYGCITCPAGGICQEGLIVGTEV
jgi:hypothetical protein